MNGSGVNICGGHRRDDASPVLLASDLSAKAGQALGVASVAPHPYSEEQLSGGQVAAQQDSVGGAARREWDLDLVGAALRVQHILETRAHVSRWSMRATSIHGQYM